MKYVILNKSRIATLFERLALDPLHMHDVDMIDLINIKSLNHDTSIDTQVLPSICEDILPRIHEHIPLKSVQ